MFSYDKLWKTMKKKNISQYRLLKGGLSYSTMTRLKENQPVSIVTIDKLCSILDCKIEDIVECKKEE